MIEVRTIEQLTNAIRKLKSDHTRGMGTMELIRSLDIDPVTQLKGGDWRGTNFASCDLKGADFSECRLAFCDFTDADVRGAIFYGSDLFKSTLHRARNVSSAYLSAEQRRYLELCRDYDAKAENNDAERVFKINQQIGTAASFEAAVSQFESILTRGLRPDPYSAALLIGRTTGRQEAWQAFWIVENTQSPVNDVVFTVLASKMKEAADVRAVIEKMRSKGLVPGSRIYNTLLSRTKSMEDMQAVLSEMQREAIVWDSVTYDILMLRTDFAGRKDLLNQLIKAGLHPTATELNRMLSGARSEDEADDAIEIANELEIGRDSTTYALLTRYKARPNAFSILVEDMNEDDLVRDRNFYTLAMTRAETFSDACFLYGQMRSDEVGPNIRIYRAFSKLAALPSSEHLEDVSLEQLIDSLIQRIGNPADIVAAGLDPARDRI